MFLPQIKTGKFKIPGIE